MLPFVSVALEYQTPGENWWNDLSFYHWGCLLFFQDTLSYIFRRKTCLLFLLFIKACNKCYKTVVKLPKMCSCSVFSPYPFLCTSTILLFCTKSSDETCETWAYFLVCICTFKTNYLDLETEKYTKFFKLANLSVRALMSSKQSFVFN